MKIIKPEDVKDYGSLSLTAISRNGMSLEHIDPNSIEDKKGRYVKFGEPENYWELCTKAVESNGLALQFVPREAENYLELCTMAVKQNGLALQFVPQEAENYLELCEIAVQRDGLALQFVPTEAENYEQLEDYAIESNPESIQFIPRIQNDFERVKDIVFKTEKISIIQHTSEEIKGDIDKIIELANIDGRVVYVMSDSLKNNPEALVQIGTASYKARSIIEKYIIPRDKQQEYREGCKLTREANIKAIEDLKGEMAELEALLAAKRENLKTLETRAGWEIK